MPKPDISNKITAAMRTVEDDVSEPSRKRSSSMASVIADLEIGETASRAQRVDPTTTLTDYAEQYAELRESLRNNVAPSVRQAKARTGGEYSIEIVDTLTQNRALFIIALVTRIS